MKSLLLGFWHSCTNILKTTCAKAVMLEMDDIAVIGMKK
jgi:hypothetical protein